METAKTETDITRMKNAESLSTEKPKLKNDEPGSARSKVSPKTTEREKMMPKIDAIAALMKDARAESLSFLLKIIDNAAPIKIKKKNP